ncbi:HDOD domain-containing protein [Methylotuvimicrobium sp. KM1]|uniref:HDOD domain-containing protein n=1 Tax=Methylotuvimicrobium sp. KM1 TaxID=3377707 RepID=UPI003850B613
MLLNLFKKKPIPKPKQAPKREQTITAERQFSGTKQSSNNIKPVNIPVKFLKRLMPLGQLLIEEEIQALKICTENFTPGSALFIRGTEVDSLVYLCKGTIYLETANGIGQEINEATLKALFPLSSGDFHQFTAIAKSNVTVIYIPKTVLLLNRNPINPLNDPLLASDSLQNNPFFLRFYEHFQQHDLKIPSFPDVALKLRRSAMQDIGIAEVVKIVNMDPVIAAKLIQIVNSPIYRTLNPISNCHDAVNRLGLKNTMNLVTAISMKSLIKSEKPTIKKRIQENWTQSIKVSCISYTLANLTRQTTPEEALLAGLLHNIGTLPMLMFADQLSENAFTLSELDQCIKSLQGQIGTIILERWEFPDSLKTVPVKVSNWFDHSGEALNLSDIVLLAKFHFLLTQHEQRVELPLINTLPAFQKLDAQLLTPEQSLQILQDAKQQISETMKFFMA